MPTKRILLRLCLLLPSLAMPLPAFADPTPVVISGGPAGGTFQIMTTAIQESKPVQKNTRLSIKAEPSAGSMENLRAIESGKADFGVVYAGHLYLARNGLLEDDPGRYEKVMAIAYLYGAPAQLIVRQGVGIHNVHDLVGKKVGVGMPGSGSHANCEQFLSHLGIWDRITKIQMGYLDTATAFAEKKIDAFWLFTGFPSGAAMVAAQKGEMDLLDLDVEARQSGFYAKYPYFTRVSVPARTYQGINHSTPTFQDSTLLVAGAGVPDAVVSDLLSMMYSNQALAHLRAKKSTFKEMRLATGTKGIITPMHPGAVSFWKKKGLR